MLKDFLWQLTANLVRSFQGSNILWHILAIALTLLLVISGFDWLYFEFVQGAPLSSLTVPAGLLGFIVPVLIPLALYLFGEFQSSALIKRTGAVLGQAVIASWLVSSAYKALTGRLHPVVAAGASYIDTSKDFNFGFFKQGIFWGWPSSHTAVAFAMAATLVALYPHKKHISLMGACYALFVGVGVSVVIHWLSDVIAGAIIGSVAGLAVARSFQHRPDTTGELEQPGYAARP